MTWNFRSLSAGEDYPVYILQPNTSDSAKFHTIEHRTRYYWRISGDSLYSGGFENVNAYMPYKRPELSVKRLMTYGDTVHSVFSGTGEYGHRLPLFVEGVADVTVDAYGTLILPDDTIRNVFRVHTIRRYWEIFSDTTNLETHLWQWYSPDYRYPVFESMRTVRSYNGNDTTEFAVSLMFSPSEQDLQDVEKPAMDANLLETADGIFTQASFLPNPVQTDLKVSYFLTRPAQTGFILHSPTGILVYNIPLHPQTDGFHVVNIPMAGLMSGAYTLYVLVDDKVIRTVIIKD